MTDQLPVEIAEEWIQAWSAKKLPADSGVVSDSRLDFELPTEDPNLCLESIISVLERIDCSSPNRLLAVLAAGPLEDLLVANGHIVIDRVEVLARRDPAFRLLLNGIWDNTIKPDVLSRLAKYRGQPW
ncbi:DUF6869 domain-containing protein [Rhodanobacter sp. L36]|uniref:DUF6869 domain-containing protein n=1 Tax=Rhodanobacter sp. L36 TaxID=1747221 RepID=UPI00131BDD98|nr:hypothetical protein [Rhodanobacter sp. L36]